MKKFDGPFCTCPQDSKGSYKSESKQSERSSRGDSVLGPDSICSCTVLSFNASSNSEFTSATDSRPDSSIGESIKNEPLACPCICGQGAQQSVRSPSPPPQSTGASSQKTRPSCICSTASAQQSARSPSPPPQSTGASSQKTRPSCICSTASAQQSARSPSPPPQSTGASSQKTRPSCICSEGRSTGQPIKPQQSPPKPEPSQKSDSIKHSYGECLCEYGDNDSKKSLEPILDPNCDPDNPKLATYDMIRAARRNIDGAVAKTPLIKSKLSDLYSMNIYLKNDFLQYTGSFKERGARNALMNIPDDKKKRGAVSASAGNHALALSYHGQELGIPIAVVMPVTSPIVKIQNCKVFGAEVIVQGANMTEAKNIAQHLAKDRGAIYINGYDHVDVLAGQGTLGIEVLEQLPSASAVVVPTGGGGLIAGIAVAIKTLKPCTRVIGVESENCPSFSNSLKAGKPVVTTTLPTIADGLAVPLPGFNAVFTAKNYVDKMIVVKEDDIAVGMLRLIEKEKFIVEGAGAIPIAAIASGQLDEFKGKNVVVILSGGNIDSTVLGRVLERGLAADGRFLKVYVTVTDRPGGVTELVRLISSVGVSIKSISQERRWLIVDVFSVMVKVVCETRDWDHALELKHLLEQHYENIKMVHVDFPPSTRSGKLEIE